MNFHRIDNYCERSECGKYTVAATRTRDEWLFGAWRVGPPVVGLGQFDKSEAAREACRADAK